MATEQDIASDSLDSSVVDVPKELLGYIKSSIIDCISELGPEQFSAKIHYATGQSPKLEVSFGGQQRKPTPCSGDTKTILVKNLPDSVDKELLEIFFESTKKQGGGPVKSLKLMREKNAAFIEFWERKSVETVLRKMPIKYDKAELDIKPFQPILRSNKEIKIADLKGLPIPNEFTYGLAKKQLKGLLPSPPPEYGPGLVALLKVGSRVVRGRDWHHGWDYDGGAGGQGTITSINEDYGTVTVTWDQRPSKTVVFSMGRDGQYTVKLATYS